MEGVVGERGGKRRLEGHIQQQVYGGHGGHGGVHLQHQGEADSAPSFDEARNHFGKMIKLSEWLILRSTWSFFVGLTVALWREEMVIIDMMQRCTRSILCSFEGDFYKAKESESLKQFY